MKKLLFVRNQALSGIGILILKLQFYARLRLISCDVLCLRYQKSPTNQKVRGSNPLQHANNRVDSIESALLFFCSDVRDSNTEGVSGVRKTVR